MGKEIWKDIKGYEGLYQISTFGSIRSVKRTVIYSNGCNHECKGTVLKQMNSAIGYKFLCLRNKKNEKNHYIHRLVAKAFISNPENKPQINHKDGNKSNNHKSNLEWVTQSENIKHAYKLGLIPKVYGENTSQSKLSNKDAKDIRELYEKRNTTQYEIASIYKVNQTTIHNIIVNKTYIK